MDNSLAKTVFVSGEYKNGGIEGVVIGESEHHLNLFVTKGSKRVDTHSSIVTPREYCFEKNAVNLIISEILFEELRLSDSLEELRKQAVENHPDGLRLCEECGELMTEGFLFESAAECFCSSTCAKKDLSESAGKDAKELWLALLAMNSQEDNGLTESEIAILDSYEYSHGFDDSHVFWTQWEE